jgi:putative membrane protein insertion efficiency factor
MAQLLQILIRSYRLAVSPWLGSNCRYYPSCSEYASQAIARYGVAKGGWLALKRIGRCHPWHDGGIDPVP